MEPDSTLAKREETQKTGERNIIYSRDQALNKCTSKIRFAILNWGAGARGHRALCVSGG